ncbi:hypothetical protein Poli38472_004000 [Pythium oligandrum]|uniref:MutL C-terminal dimerisation domain-containing protein n=1 Tax=Pythium oligandrum TaxID=41045 RepID=A0A8K1CMV7_PYTOL|nr:hypothetical protein Poli38472_004000 [Pythium oligandrum]|eukprot:TMW66235.1 hypothetical protein Poli38472_004000 [Pythium oligandrum]
MAHVQAVDEATQRVIAASYAVPDLATAVEEAIYNALDAHAKHLQITVDLAQASFSVDDDGEGIHPDSLYEHIFECSASSKTNDARTHGKRGRYLFALASMAKSVEMESRIHDQWTSHRKVLQEGQIVFNARSKVTRTSRGSKLTVRQLFHLLPVRQIDMQRQSASRVRVAKTLRTFCTNLSMIWPSLSIQTIFTDHPQFDFRIHGVSACRDRLESAFGSILTSDLEYLSFENDDLAFSVRGYVAVLQDGGDSHSNIDSPGWRQARSYYQFAYLDNRWLEDFQRFTCKVLNEAAIAYDLGILIFVLKITTKQENEYELVCHGQERQLLLKRPELLCTVLQDFVKHLTHRVHEAAEMQQIRVSDSVCALDAAHETSGRYEMDYPEAEMMSNGRQMLDFRGYGIGNWPSSTWDMSPLRYDDVQLVLPSHADRFIRSLTVSDEPRLYYEPRDANEQAFKSEDMPYWAEQNVGSASSVVDLESADEGTRYDASVGSIDVHPCESCGHVNRYRSSDVGDDSLTWEYLVQEVAHQKRYPRHSLDPDIRDANLFDYDDSQDEAQDSRMYHEQNEEASSLEDCDGFNEVFFGNYGAVPVSHSRMDNRGRYQELETSSGNRDVWLSGRCVRDNNSVDSSVDVGVADVSNNVTCHDGNPASTTPETPTESMAKSVEFHAESGGDVVSEYFSIERLVERHGHASFNSLHWSSKRTVLAASVPHHASRCRVNPLPNDLHSMPKSIKLDKSILSRLEVIKQVDRKFILAKVFNSDGHDDQSDEKGLILCIDQHAADERIRLEALEASVFGSLGDERNVDVMEHPEPLCLNVNAQEHDTLVQYEEEIRSWGFEFDINGHEQIWLSHTPKIDSRIAQPDDLREYLQLLSSLRGASVGNTLRPPVITRFLHSRACRSAIMFGDYLGRSQCQDLMDSLRQCQLPFQCAHGRPSVVPLVEFVGS